MSAGGIPAVAKAYGLEVAKPANATFGEDEPLENEETRGAELDLGHGLAIDRR
jgi:hypothetical protein